MPAASPWHDFDVQLIEEIWREDWDIRYGGQPLSSTCADLSGAGFLIERIVEPLPRPGMGQLYPTSSEQQDFIMFRLLGRPPGYNPSTRNFVRLTRET